jgi:hypothetical protein
VANDETWAWKAGPSGPLWWRHRVDETTAWLERLGSHDYLRRKSALAGVTGGHPFHDDVDLLELVLRLPPEYAFDANLSRPLLRTSMAGLMPDEVRLRPDKSTFNAFLEESFDQWDLEATSVLLGPDAQLGRYVHLDQVRDRFLVPLEARSPGWLGVLWRLVNLELWLRNEADPSFVADAAARLSLTETPSSVERSNAPAD